jgi:plasmid maintenance system antidote protein VapI
MIGLEFISNLYYIKHTDLAKELGIKRQNINLWIKGKGKIPQKYIVIFVEKFNIPEEYFQKELTNKDKINILELYIQILKKEQD